MKIYRELTFEGDPIDFDKYLEDVENALNGGWRRDIESERWFEENAGKGARTGFVDRAFVCPKTARTPSARLWVAMREPGVFQVPNVTPIDEDELSYGEYNAVIEAFYERFARGLADRHGIRATLGPDEADLSEDLPDSVYKALRGFSDAANRSLGSSHPQDAPRWQRFIIEAHEADVDLSAATLERWLIEDAGWPEDVARELAGEYEFGRSLLAREHGVATT